MNAVNQLFENSGRATQGDNRNYFVKALNKVLQDGFITIEVVQKGKVWTNPRHLNKDGTLREFNIIIKGYGYIRRVYLRDFSAKDLLKQVGEFIQDPRIAEMHIKSISVEFNEVCQCERCNGMGIIPQFYYYCSGICFECYGSKYSFKRKSIAV